MPRPATRWKPPACAQRGIYLARQGKHQEAEAIVSAIRDEFGKQPNAEVTAWVSLVEALIRFYSHPGPKALDRLRRAHALSRAMNHPVLVPLCAAWLAHIEFSANRMEPMLPYAVQALQLAQPTHHAALARVSLVVADALFRGALRSGQGLVRSGAPTRAGRGRRRHDQCDAA